MCFLFLEDGDSSRITAQELRVPQQSVLRGNFGLRLDPARPKLWVGQRTGTHTFKSLDEYYPPIWMHELAEGLRRVHASTPSLAGLKNLFKSLHQVPVSTSEAERTYDRFRLRISLTALSKSPIT